MRTLLSIAFAVGFVHALAGCCRADEGMPLNFAYDPTASPVITDASDHGGGGGGVNYLPRFWAETDFLMIYSKAAPIPALVTTGPLTGLGPNGFPGSIGPAGTTVVLGGQNIAFNPQVGARVILGSWLDHDCKFGVEGSYFRVVERSEHSSINSPGNPPLSIPYFNAFLQQESSVGIAFARDINPFSGGATLSVTSRIQGADANFICRIYEKERSRLDALVGFRWIGLDENLFFDTHSQVVGQGDTFRTTDAFRCSNDFYGAQFGLREQVYFGRLYFRATGKVALGSVHQLTRTDGSLVTDDFPGLAGNPARFNGGYLVQPTNTGRFATDRFAWAPEATIGAGWQVCDWMRLSLSATLLYISTVARPGDQIDRTINPTQSPTFTGDPNAALQGPARPQYLGRSNEYIMQGWTAGIEVRF